MQVLQLNFIKAFRELLPKLMGEALQIVMVVTILGFLLALFIGLLLAIGRYTKLNQIIILFLELIRGTPLLVQLVYVYYVVPLLIGIIGSLITGTEYKMVMSATTAGMIGLAINYGAYLSEVFRSSIIAIDSGQTEAALALGFSGQQAMLRIVLPQAFRNSIPVFGNYLVMIVKDTSLILIWFLNRLLF